MEDIKLAQPTYYSDEVAVRFTLQPFNGKSLRSIIC